MQHVTPGSPAEKAGIESGDIITGLNGKTIRDGSELTSTVSGMSVGSTASVSAVRDGKPQTFQVAIADRSKVFTAAVPGQVPLPDGNMVFLSSGPASGPLPALFALQGKMGTATESLGQQIIEGVTAQGARTTSTIEAGEIGNDRPIHIVTERWYSRDLETAVKMTHSDPRSGQETLQLTNISRVEPTPDLFQVPPGYQMASK